MYYSAQIFLFGAELAKAIDDERTPRRALGFPDDEQQSCDK